MAGMADEGGYDTENHHYRSHIRNIAENAGVFADTMIAEKRRREKTSDTNEE
jgi:hypothetical protein